LLLHLLLSTLANGQEGHRDKDGTIPIGPRVSSDARDFAYLDPRTAMALSAISIANATSSGAIGSIARFQLNDDFSGARCRLGDIFNDQRLIKGVNDCCFHSILLTVFILLLGDEVLHPNTKATRVQSFRIFSC
jgi:hypothetical protein